MGITGTGASAEITGAVESFWELHAAVTKQAISRKRRDGMAVERASDVPPARQLEPGLLHRTSMRRWLLAGSLCIAVGLPVHAGAQQCTNGPECIQRWIRPIPPNPTEALVTAVLAAPVLLAGGVVTVAKLSSEEKAPPAGVKAPPPDQPQRRPELVLIPNQSAPPASRTVSPEERAKQEQLVRINDAITNVGIALGGAAVLAGIITGIVKKK
jgi:hypothetical protein